ncbi:MAG: methionyl-tRNA formyltransferase [Flavobacteriales bacterium]|jgi:methionyl-tRNA formyltransferase
MSKRIIFMGTPEFAVASLKTLHESELEVAAVVTVADKPAGRGRKIQTSAVKEYAVSQGIPVLQPLKLRAEDFIEALKSYDADLFVVVAFRMLPEQVWQMPKLGTINLHGSLLPDYRGAAPIHWAVMNGDSETGCTTFLIEKEIDTGNVLQQAKFPISTNATTGEVHDEMKEVGARLLLDTCCKLFDQSIQGKPQSDFEAKQMRPAPKLHKENCKIDWSLPCLQIHNFIRGLNPFPTAWTETSEMTYKIHFGNPTDISSNDVPGALIQNTEGLFVVCGDQKLLKLLVLQPQAKKRMDVTSFVLGNNLHNQRFI